MMGWSRSVTDSSLPPQMFLHKCSPSPAITLTSPSLSLLTSGKTQRTGSTSAGGRDGGQIMLFENAINLVLRNLLVSTLMK